LSIVNMNESVEKIISPQFFSVTAEAAPCSPKLLPGHTFAAL